MNCRSDPFRPTGRSTAKGSCDRTTGAGFRGTESLLTHAGAEWIRTFGSALDRQQFVVLSGFGRSTGARSSDQLPASANRSSCRARSGAPSPTARIRRRHTKVPRCRRCERVAEPNVRIRSPRAVSPRTFGSGRGLPLGCGPTTQRVRGDIDDPSSSTTTYLFSAPFSKAC